MVSEDSLVPIDEIGKRIFLIRGRRVMLDVDLAALYAIETRVLNQAVRRNKARFPEDFAFELSREEIMRISQIVISSKSYENYRFSKCALGFTEHGVSMLSSVLNSERAIQINIQIMRAFIHLKQMLSLNAEMEAKFAELERRVGRHDKYIRELFAAIRKLMAPIEPPKPPIGFRTESL